MPRGQPDYGAYAAKEITGSVSDMAELAARLGSIVTFDRRGDVAFLDDYESGIEKWEESHAEGAEWGTVGLSAALAESGSFSTKLVTKGAVDGYAQVVYILPYWNPINGRLGVEIKFTLPSNLMRFEMPLFIQSLEGWFWTGIEYDSWDNVLKIYGDGAFEDFVEVDLERSATLFHVVKFVIDINTNRYVRVLLDSIEYDASDRVITVVPGGARPYMEIYLTALNRVGNATSHTCFIDDLIFTRNEP